jgi:hypothetical protein
VDILEHFAATRVPRGQEQCECCEGDGRHGDKTCVRCGGSGHVRAGSDDPFCPGHEDRQPRPPRRRHWRQASIRWVGPEEYGKYSYPDYPRARTPASLAKYLRKAEPEYYAALHAHIAEHGVQEPVLLRERDQRGQPLRRPVVMSGHHRAAVAWEQGRTLPVGDYDNPEDYAATVEPSQQWWQGHGELKQQYTDPRRHEGARQLPVTEIGPLYHGTTAERAQAILAGGFQGNLVHLTPNADLARSYGEGRAQADGGGIPAVLRIEKVRGVSAAETAYGSPDLNRQAGAHYMDKGPEVLVLDPGAMHGITRHAKLADHPEYQPPEKFDSEAYERDPDHYFDAYRARKRTWNSQIRHGLSVGHLSHDEAESLGWHPSGHDNRTEHAGVTRGGWQPLPHELYHVTTDEPGVRAHGLRTREELGQNFGHGLGGGESDSISFTTSHELARHLLSSLHEYHGFLKHGHPQDLLDQAARGEGASRPFHHDIIRHYRSDWEEGRPVSPDLDATLRGKRHERTMGRPEHEMAAQGWSPSQHPDNASWDAPAGRIHTDYERPATRDEQIEDKSRLYRTFSAFRENAGGAPDPMYFSTDEKAFAAKNPEHFALLHVRPRPGAQGYPVHAMSEWRTGSGDAADVQHAEHLGGIRREAGQRGELPELEYYHVRQGREKGGYHVVAAAHQGQIIGHLTWGPGDDRIGQLWVHPQYRRHGVADAIYQRARWVEPGLRHHPDRTEAGEAWAASVSDDPGQRLHDTTSADAERKGAWAAKQLQERLDTGHRTMQRLAAAARVPAAERTENVAHMLAHYQPTDFGTWAEVDHNFNWDVPENSEFVEDVRRNGVRRPIPVDYESSPPRVMNGHRRLLAARRAGVLTVPTRQHEGFADPDDPDPMGCHGDWGEHEQSWGQHEGSRGTGRWFAVGPALSFMAIELFHGSDREEPFSRFDFSRRSAKSEEEEESPLYKQEAEPGQTTRWWNSRLGSHFTSEHGVASEIAQRMGGNGNVYHVDLRMRNPRHYDSEHHLAEEGVDWARKHGYRGLRNLGFDTEQGWHYADALQNHPQSQQIADGFRRHLQGQGYDGITYGNEYEGTKGHLCAIAFHPDQAKITETHGGYDPCRYDAIEHEAAWHSQEKLFHMEHEQRPSQPEPGSVHLWRGLHLGEGDAREAALLHHDPAAAIYRKGRAGIHWTDDQTSAWRFAHGRDAEGWREDPDADETSHSMGVIFHGQVHPRHILQEGSEELENYRDAYAILHEGHPEQEVTVREGAPVHITGLTATTVGPDGEERSTYHPYGFRHRADWHAQEKLFDMPHVKPVPAHEARPWYHGTRYRLRPGQLLEGGKVNMNQGYGGTPGEHVYYSGRPDIAAEFADAAYGPEHARDARPRVYQVQPDESHEIDSLEEPETDSWRAGRARVVREVPLAQAQRGRIAVFVPTERIFGPTYGLDHRLFDESEHMRPAVRDALMARLGGVLESVLGPDWHLVTTAWLAGSQASRWTGPDLEGNGDLDILVGLSHGHARRVAPELETMTDEEIERHLNQVLRERFNAPGWHPPFDPDGTYDLTGYAIHPADIRAIQPYAAYDLSNGSWTVPPPDLPSWSAESFPQGPALMQQARALIAEVRAILRLPEPFRRQEAERIWHYIHEGRAEAFSPGGLGWQGTGNVLEKALDQASGALVGKLKAVIYGPDDGHPHALAQGMTTADVEPAHA